MDWTWAFDEWVPKLMGFGALGGALVTFVLSLTLGVWLLARGSGNPRRLDCRTYTTASRS